MGVIDCMNPLPMLKPEKNTSETSVLKAYSSNQQRQHHLEAYWNQHSLVFPSLPTASVHGLKLLQPQAQINLVS